VAISPWTVGQLSPTWTIPMMRDSRIMDITGVTTGQLSLILYNASKVVIGSGAGTIAILEAKPAVISYAPASGDVSSAGTFYIRVKVNFNGTTPDFSDMIQWTINA
jgi:hypothetical protein